MTTDMPDVCKNCGATIPEDNDLGGRQPCPNCGKTARIINASVTEQVVASMTATWSLVHGHTGREIKESEAYNLASEWAEASEHSDLLAHPLAAKLGSLIGKVGCVNGESLLLFRGRGVEDRVPTSEEMGPPPIGASTSDGRYHQSGKRVLYLSDSEVGTHREYSRWYKSGRPFIQRFLLPLNELRIADFTTTPPDHLISAVFAKAEELMVEGRGAMNYIFSQVVAELVSSHFDGMRIPGVGGSPGAHYTNVVVFDPHSTRWDWRTWLDADSAPYQLATASESVDEHIAIAAYYLWETSGKTHGHDVEDWLAAKREIERAFSPPSDDDKEAEE